MKQVCDILDEKGILYDWYVLGTAFEKSTFEEIQGWFQNNKNVHFIGYKDNVYPYIKKMDYLALLTDRESWGLVISEALILGVPCIVTDFKGVEKQITDKENGIILGMTDTDNSYSAGVENMVSMKDRLKQNVIGKDYHREDILRYWDKMLEKPEKK